MSKPELVDFSRGLRWECQWQAVLMPKHFRWIDFDFVKLFIEYEKALATIHVEVALLGFKLKILLPGPKGAEYRELMARKKAVESGDVELVEVAEGVMMPKEMLEMMIQGRQMAIEHHKSGHKNQEEK